MDQTKLTAYEIISRQELPDIQSTGWILRHKKTGARVMLVENGDENKVFNIAFRTPPKNSTGVAHILEHSVLCGSRNYPLKDPFVELVKGSLNTFLNAMTYPDKTCYPVASCNDRDFQNLMSVYLDAVFYPNVYKREEIFLQEGWHYHLEDPEGPLTLNGVVYNEMKGAFSSADDVLEREIMNHLFPDTPYGVESGGDPRNIPDLTYQEFLDFHKTYYHPSNSYIYLYGDMDMAEKLDYIDREYLSHFDAITVDSAIPLQASFDRLEEASREYPIAESEDEEENTFLSYNMVTGECSDLLKCLALEILDYALISAPGAPLKKTLLEEGIGSDVYGAFQDGIRQPYFSIIAKGARKEQKEAFVSTVRRVLQENVEKGIDRKALLAGINYLEFRYREADFSSYPKGLMYGLDILGDWLYSDENPFSQVERLPLFEKIKKAAGEGYFEDIVRQCLLDNPHGCILTLIPKKGLQAQEEKELAEKLEAYRAGLSREELEKLTAATRGLALYQEEPDSPEDIAKLPFLTRKDINPKARTFSNQECDVDGSLLLFHEVESNGIGYVDVMFELDGLDVDRIHTLGLLKAVFGMVDTEHYSYGELFNEINASTGGLVCGVEIFESVSDPDSFRVMLSFRGKALYANGRFWTDMLREIITTSRLEDTRRLKEIIGEGRSRLQASLVSGGHGTAVMRSAAYSSASAAFQDELSGVGFYQYLENLDRNFDTLGELTAQKLRDLAGEILRPENLKVSYTGEAFTLEPVKELMRDLKASLGSGTGSKAAGKAVMKPLPIKNEGFKTAGQVQYVAQTGNYLRRGFSFNGALGILKVILSYDYLWMNIRVKGGAYGCFSAFKRNGESYFASYRDPHLHNTLKIFEGVPDYVESFEADEDEMTRYIIGTISGKDVPRTPQMQGSLSNLAYYIGLTDEMVQEERDQILSARAEDIRALAPLVRAVLEEGHWCVLGSENAIEGARDVLDHVEPLFH